MSYNVLIKVCILMVFGVFFTITFGAFSSLPPKRNLVPIVSHPLALLLTSLPLQPQATPVSLLPIFMYLPIPDISNKWNPTQWKSY